MGLILSARTQSSRAKSETYKFSLAWYSIALEATPGYRSVVWAYTVALANARLPPCIMHSTISFCGKRGSSFRNASTAVVNDVLNASSIFLNVLLTLKYKFTSNLSVYDTQLEYELTLNCSINNSLVYKNPGKNVKNSLDWCELNLFLNLILFSHNFYIHLLKVTSSYNILHSN